MLANRKELGQRRFSGADTHLITLGGSVIDQLNGHWDKTSVAALSIAGSECPASIVNNCAQLRSAPLNPGTPALIRAMEK
jgi:hypothetical protein